MIVSKNLLETRNGCDIEWVEEDIEDVGSKKKELKRFGSYRVVSSLHRRIIKDRIGCLDEACAVADAQPSSPDGR